jgi:hypothetical protein
VSGIVYVDNDNRLLLQSAHTYDAAGDKVYLDGSVTVQVTLTDTGSVAIVGETWPLALLYIQDSQGDFQGVLRNELVLSEGQTIFAELTIDAGTDQFAHLRGTLLVHRRTF